MSETDPKIIELETRLDSLVRTQIDFQVEISAIRKELTRLRNAGRPAANETLFDQPQAQPKIETARTSPPVVSSEPADHAPTTRKLPPVLSAPAFGYAEPGDHPTDRRPGNGDTINDHINSYAQDARKNLEKFIGENLISKIGIIVLILGVGIGAKYAIDNNLISPTTRIVLGYFVAAALIVFAARLKVRYLNFSSVLLSGGLASAYFVTYFAYSLYSLMPQAAAFAVMAILTAATVWAALFYSRQVIAHIGLVGAYSVPFLLSDDSGRYLFLFVYMAVINAGILAISIKKYWKSLFYTSSAFTWLIFFAWFASKYSPTEHFYLALTFLAVFFWIFYAAKVIHGVMRSESQDSENLACILGSGLVFYSFCFAISDWKASPGYYLLFFVFLAVNSLAILVTSYRYYGRIFIFLSFPLTWLIFGKWFIDNFQAEQHFWLAAIFAAAFFVVYYVATLIFRVVTEESGTAENMSLVLTNSFIFYGFGYAIIDSRPELRGYEGLFTAAHAFLHFMVAQVLSRKREDAIDVVRTLAILVITFATIAIPIQFDGNQITLMWSVEGAVLFWFGRVRAVRLFEYFSLPIMALASFSMLATWVLVYNDRVLRNGADLRQPFANGDMITGLVFAAAFAFIYFVNRDKEYEPAIGENQTKPLGYLVVTTALFALYNTLRIEIGNYYFYQSVIRQIPFGMLTGQRPGANHDLSRFNVITQIDYTLLFFTVMAIVNLRRVRSVAAALMNVVLSVATLSLLVTLGMYVLYGLRLSYVAGDTVELFGTSLTNIAIRYVSYMFSAAMLATLYEYSRNDLLADKASDRLRSIAYDSVLYPTALIVASCELMNIAGHLYIVDADKFGLSILWGVFALGMIAIGIAKGKAHLRISAIVLLAFTLIKLFFYDISELGTIPKTLLFVSLGLLMLFVSFLYNKYKNAIFGIDAENSE